MRMILPCLLFFIQFFEVYAEVIFQHLTQSQSLELFCSPPLHHGSPSGLYLYHRSAQSQTTLLSMENGGELRVEAKHRGRLRLCGGLDSLQINATITHLERSDTGLYMWELTYTEENGSNQLLICDQKLFLLVEGTGTCQCCHLYPALLWTIFIAVVLLLLLLIWLAIDKCAKVKDNHKPQPPVPIYEEMTRKQQTTGVSQNTHEAPSHPQEPDFPVYANPNFRQPQDNYYACPRQLALRAT